MAVALVHQAVAHDDTAGVSVTATITSSAAGNLLVAVVSWLTGATGSVIITDNLGQAWTKAASGSRSGSTGTRTEIWYRGNTAAGVTSVTATPSVGAAKAISVSEWSGVDTGTPLYAGTNSTVGGTASPMLTPSLTPTGNNPLAIGAWNLASGTITETLLTAGYTAMTDAGGGVSGNQNRPAYRIGVSGAQAVSWSLSAGANWGAALALFNPASVPGVGQPVLTVTLDGVDITADVGPEGTTAISWQRGANFNGSAEAPGTCVVVVSNRAGKYNPANGASSIASHLKIGKELRVEAIWGGINYGIFHGYIRRIVPIPGSSAIVQTAELHAEDALWKFGRYEANLPFSPSLSYMDFRGALLDAMGELATRRRLSGAAGEADVLFSGVSARTALDVLTELNLANGSLHFIQPDPDPGIGYRYRTIDRGAMQAAGAIETYVDTDLASMFATDMGGFDYTDEGVINSQRVVPHPRLTIVGALLWEFGQYPYDIPASTPTHIWASWTDPADSLVVDERVIQVPDPGMAAITVTSFDTAADILINYAGTNLTYLLLRLFGTTYVPADPTSTLSADATSQTAYGMMAGSPIDSVFIPSRALAQGLGDYIVWRYATPRAKPTLTFTNRFPTILARDIGDRIALTSGLLSTAATNYLIRALSGAISADGFDWVVTYDLEEAPPGLTLFTIGGTAAQGVGGGAVLAY